MPSVVLVSLLKLPSTGTQGQIDCGRWTGLHGSQSTDYWTFDASASNGNKTFSLMRWWKDLDARRVACTIAMF